MALPLIERKKLVRIYSPYLPTPITEGAFHVIHYQKKALEELNFRVELVHWKSKSSESYLKKIKRVGQSFFTEFASPETFYYSLTDDPARAGLAIADYGIYHFSLCYPWLKYNRPRPEKKTIVHFHNIESNLFALRKQKDRFSSPGSSMIHGMNESKLRAHEASLAGLADELWFLSQVDQEEYQSRLAPGQPSVKTRVIGPTADPVVRIKRRDQFLKRLPQLQEQPLCAGTLGRFDFEPNRASLAWIIRELAPLLSKRGFSGKIQVAGPGVPNELKKAAASFPFIELLGFVEDLESFWSNLTFVLVPQKGGSGVRIKLLEALASGIPTLAHSSAVAPLDPRLRTCPFLLTSDTPEEWAEQLIGEHPGKTRALHVDRPLEPALLGADVYRFLIADFNS